ncbi:response regulator transcription factor [Listeria monocytogenes]|nr:response regulator transcription factor [Listeria monocytogenes]
MLPVFICEDNRMQRERLTKYIEDYIMVEHFDMKLELSTGDPFELVSRMPTHQGMGLYFLDIDLGQPDMNGFELAQEIRKFDPRGFIIFITTHAELSYMTFTYKVSDKKIIHELLDDILFFETAPTIHKVILHGKNRQVEFYGKLKNIEKMLDESFYRCHRSYIVNKKNIHELDTTKGVVKMSNGENCYASSKLIKSLSL